MSTMPTMVSSENVTELMFLPRDTPTMMVPRPRVRTRQSRADDQASSYASTYTHAFRTLHAHKALMLRIGAGVWFFAAGFVFTLALVW